MGTKIANLECTSYDVHPTSLSRYVRVLYTESSVESVRAVQYNHISFSVVIRALVGELCSALHLYVRTVRTEAPTGVRALLNIQITR
jgi:hypothetical protein